MYGKRQLAQYRQANAAVENDPHRVIALLLAGVIAHCRQAGVCIAQNDVPGKIEAIGCAMDRIDALRLSLDHDAGGDIARGLESLYEYASLRLVEANLHNDAEKLQEVDRLLGEIESAWNAIPREAAAPQALATGGAHG